MNKNVCLVTTNHISTNPRLVKEALALTNAGFRVHIIFSQHTAYLAAEDFKILAQNPTWQHSCVDWRPSGMRSRFRRIVSGLFQKAATRLYRRLSGVPLARLILNRNFSAQLKIARKTKADLFIAHNAGALAVAAEAAKSNQALYAFDAEDYHRGEQLSEVMISSVQKVEDHYLPDASFITAASPLIGAEYERLFNRQVISVPNVFPLIAHRKHVSSSLSLFWFSQTVGLNRGIQDVVKALKPLEHRKIEFHIYGFLPTATRTALDQLVDSLHFLQPPLIIYHDPVPGDVLLKVASLYDIGLAIEPGFCKNNEIALSNKIFTYLAGGNAIIFSNTPGQKEFYKMYDGIGALYEPGDIERLVECIASYDDDRILLSRHQANSHDLYVRELNWDIQQRQFLKQIEKAIGATNRAVENVVASVTI